MKHVLIVTYYWPPAGGPGVQRALKFAKYLPEFGYLPSIVTVENNQQLGRDESLLRDIDPKTEVYKTRVFLQKNNLTGKSFTDETGFLSNLKRWLRGNIFIPDAKIFWLFQSKKLIKQLLDKQTVDIVFITAPPQTAHLIGLWIKDKFKLPVVHDFRDPWTDAVFLREFPRMRVATAIDRFLEKRVLQSADAIISVSAELVKLLNNKVEVKKSFVIANGFDEDVNTAQKKDVREFVYTGTISETAIPEQFLLSLKELNLKLRVVGHVHDNFTRFVQKNELANYVTIDAPVSHDAIINIQRNADALLLTVANIAENKGILTGKIFEYLAANRPIIAIAPKDGDLAEIVRKSGLGITLDYIDDYSKKLKIFLKSDFLGDEEYIKTFHRKELSKKLAEVFNDLLNTV